MPTTHKGQRETTREQHKKGKNVQIEDMPISKKKKVQMPTLTQTKEYYVPAEGHTLPSQCTDTHTHILHTDIRLKPFTV